MSVEFELTEDGQVRLIFVDRRGRVQFQASLDIETWDRLADEIDEAIDAVCEAYDERENSTVH